MLLGFGLSLYCPVYKMTSGHKIHVFESFNIKSYAHRIKSTQFQLLVLANKCVHSFRTSALQALRQTLYVGVGKKTQGQRLECPLGTYSNNVQAYAASDTL